MQPFWLLPKHLLWHLPRRPQAVPCLLQHLRQHLDRFQLWLQFHHPQTAPCQCRCLPHPRQTAQCQRQCLHQRWHPRLRTAPCLRQCLHQRWHPRLRTAPCLRQCLLQRLQTAPCQHRCMRHRPPTAQQVCSGIYLSPSFLSASVTLLMNTKNWTISVLCPPAMVLETCTHCRDRDRVTTVTSAVPGHAQMHVTVMCTCM